MAAKGVGAALRAFLEAANAKSWDEVRAKLHPDVAVKYNKTPESSDDFVQRLTEAAAKGDRLSADTLVIDEAAQSVGARLVISNNNGAAEGTPAQAWDVVLVSFKDGKIARLYQVTSQFSRLGAPGPCPPEATTKPSKNPLSADEMRKQYWEYLHTFDHGSIAEDMPKYWKEISLTNGEPMSTAVNIGFLERVVKPVKAGLEHKVEEIVVDEERQRIAVRIALDGVPENNTLQTNGPGERTEVHEHALYGYEDGKIAWIWNALDISLPPPPGSGTAVLIDEPRSR